MKIQLSQKEVSRLIVDYLVENKRIESESVSIQYEINIRTTGNELTVFVEED